MSVDLLGSLTLVIGLFFAAIVLGLAGRRWRSVRRALVAIGPLYSLGVVLYFVVEGTSSVCTGAGATFRCAEVTYASTWGVQGSLEVGLVVILTMTPIASAWLRNRVPSLLAAIALPVVISLFAATLAAWVPAWAGVVAAAIAGPSQQPDKLEP